MAAFDMMVCASREEGFSLAVAEAMAAGIPVISTRCGGPEDLIIDRETGLLVPTEDAVMMADAIVRLARDSALAMRLSSAAHGRWATRFTASHGAARFLGLVHELAASAASP